MADTTGCTRAINRLSYHKLYWVEGWFCRCCILAELARNIYDYTYSNADYSSCYCYRYCCYYRHDCHYHCHCPCYYQY